jgi:glutathione-independent formaldehyde dehydrogenase
MTYHRGLMQAVLNDRVQIAKAVNATVITLDEAPKGYQDFDSGVAKKFVLNPHGLIDGASRNEREKAGLTPPGPLLASAA